MFDPFADAQAWYDRAQEHIGEYRRLTSGQHEQIWTLHSSRHEDGSYLYSLRLNRSLLTKLKPIACEAANALFQSLDNIIAVGARPVVGEKRNRKFSWPWKVEPDPNSTLAGAVRPAIGKKLNELRKNGLPQSWLRLIEETFAAPAVGLPHIDVVKEVSLSGKHWELVPTGADAAAVSWIPKGSTQQVHAEIPADYFETNDEYVFHKGETTNVSHFLILTGIKLVASNKRFQPDPITAFEYTSRFVANALEKARRLCPK